MTIKNLGLFLEGMWKSKNQSKIKISRFSSNVVRTFGQQNKIFIFLSHTTEKKNPWKLSRSHNIRNSTEKSSNSSSKTVYDAKKIQ